MSLYRTRWLRRIVVPLLSRFNPGDVTIGHHYTGQPFRLHSFKHKGYWYHGRNRERETMELFGRLLRPGDCVFEVGGHIGYITAYFARWVGPRGAVHVFEPGDNNLPYLEHNTRALANVTIVRKAVGAEDGVATFFLEDLTGQNNTLVRGYDVFDSNRARAHSSAEYRETKVELVRLDSYRAAQRCRPDFVKIDVEGAELDVLRGMQEILRELRPSLMVEVTRNAPEVVALLRCAGYVPFDDRLGLVTGAPHELGNVFALHREQHERLLLGLGLAAAARDDGPPSGDAS